MKTSVLVSIIVVFCLILLPAAGAAPAPSPFSQSTSLEKPGDTERAALGKVAFLTGEWEGEGWSLNETGGRTKFWIHETYRFRGNKDLMDMEGRFADLQPDGTRAPEDYALGILFFDRGSGEYRMWHYSSNGTVFTVKMDVDLKARTAQYTLKDRRGVLRRFRLVVGADGVWISKIEIVQPDGSWRQVLEFRMKRVGGPPL